MTLTSRGRVATVVVIVVLAFAAAFVVGRASAGSGSQQLAPTHIAPSTTHLQVRGLTLPSTLPTLHPKPSEPKPASSGAGKSTPSPAPAESPSPSVAPKSTPAPSGGGGKVIVG
jgi:hypothetical protein